MMRRNDRWKKKSNDGNRNRRRRRRGGGNYRNNYNNNNNNNMRSIPKIFVKAMNLSRMETQPSINDWKEWNSLLVSMSKFRYYPIGKLSNENSYKIIRFFLDVFLKFPDGLGSEVSILYNFSYFLITLNAKQKIHLTKTQFWSVFKDVEKILEIVGREKKKENWLVVDGIRILNDLVKFYCLESFDNEEKVKELLSNVILKYLSYEFKEVQILVIRMISNLCENPNFLKNNKFSKNIYLILVKIFNEEYEQIFSNSGSLNCRMMYTLLQTFSRMILNFQSFHEEDRNQNNGKKKKTYYLHVEKFQRFRIIPSIEKLKKIMFLGTELIPIRISEEEKKKKEKKKDFIIVYSSTSSNTEDDDDSMFYGDKESMKVRSESLQFLGNMAKIHFSSTFAFWNILVPQENFKFYPEEKNYEKYSEKISICTIILYNSNVKIKTASIRCLMNLLVKSKSYLEKCSDENVDNNSARSIFTTFIGFSQGLTLRIKQLYYFLFDLLIMEMKNYRSNGFVISFVCKCFSTLIKNTPFKNIIFNSKLEVQLKKSSQYIENETDEEYSDDENEYEEEGEEEDESEEKDEFIHRLICLFLDIVEKYKNREGVLENAICNQSLFSLENLYGNFENHANTDMIDIKNLRKNKSNYLVFRSLVALNNKIDIVKLMADNFFNRDKVIKYKVKESSGIVLCSIFKNYFQFMSCEKKFSYFNSLIDRVQENFKSFYGNVRHSNTPISLYIISLRVLSNISFYYFKNDEENNLKILVKLIDKVFIPYTHESDNSYIVSLTLQMYSNVGERLFSKLDEKYRKIILNYIEYCEKEGNMTMICSSLKVNKEFNRFSMLIGDMNYVNKNFENFIHFIKSKSVKSTVRVKCSSTFSVLCDSIRKNEKWKNLMRKNDETLSRNFVRIIIHLLNISIQWEGKVRFNVIRSLGSLICICSREILRKEMIAKKKNEFLVIENESEEGIIKKSLEDITINEIFSKSLGLDEHIKVKWNTCYSLGLCLLNEFISLKHKQKIIETLISALVQTDNFKVKIQSINAIHNSLVEKSSNNNDSNFDNILIDEMKIKVLESISLTLLFLESLDHRKDIKDKKHYVNQLSFLCIESFFIIFLSYFNVESGKFDDNNQEFKKSVTLKYPNIVVKVIKAKILDGNYQEGVENIKVLQGICRSIIEVYEKRFAKNKNVLDNLQTLRFYVIEDKSFKKKNL